MCVNACPRSTLGDTPVAGRCCCGFGDGGKLHAAFVADGPITYDATDGWTSFYFDREETQRSVVARRNATAATFLHTLVAGDWVTVDGATGRILVGQGEVGSHAAVVRARRR